MNDQHTISTHYAILININVYSNSLLKSSVRDVQKIKECFKSKLSSIDIQTFTTSDDDTSLKYFESWSTCRNMTLTLEMITFRAQSEDFIYIHYFNYEIKLDSCYKLSSQSIKDLALVLLDKNSSRMRLLSEPRLADLLKFMIDKALIITLVLNCCFLTSVYRNNNLNVWYFSCDRIDLLTYSSISKYDLADENTRSTSRDASIRDN